VPYAAIGALVVATSALLLAGAVRSAARGREGLAVLLVAAAGLALRAFAASDAFLHPWDERYHALVAKNLLAHPAVPTLYDDPVLPYDHRDWGGNHVWVHKQPLALWLMAASMGLFGVNELAARLPSVLLSAAAVALTYLLGRHVGGPRVGVLAAALHATNGFLVDLAAGRASTDHVDALFVVLVELGVVLALRGGRRWAATAISAGAVIGLAALAKSVMGVLGLVAWAPLLWRSGARRLLASAALAAAAGVAVFLPWQIYIHSAFPLEAAHEARDAVAHAVRVFDGQAGGLHFHLELMLRYFGELSIVPMAWLGWAALRGRADRLGLGLFLWWLVTYGFYSLAATKMPAYPMTAAPAIFVATAGFWWRVRDALAQLGCWRKALAVLLLLLLVALPLRFLLERTRIFSDFDPRPAWAQAYRASRGALAGARKVIFNVERPIELMFYSGGSAYRHVPSAAEVAALKARGYDVVLWDDGRLPPGGVPGARVLRIAP
jgi:4-amino-4-deoxy-L-arabinose transferase